MGILKQKKNKKFSYSPRYFDDKGEGNPYKIESKFDRYRKTVGQSPGGVVARFKSAWSELKDESDKDTNRRILFIALILILIFLFIIDFDLSIFFGN